MKIAIQGHSNKGNDVIKILESLGGKNAHELCGNGKDSVYHYHINNCGIIVFSPKHALCNYKFYTLEEFEKEFPFKIGDKVITAYGNVGIIRSLTPDNDEIPYCIETEKGYIYCHPSNLKPYKEMKEKRNITLTLEKAKEWYKKGGELKEVALQAYSEEELSKVELPKSWKEFCDNYMIDDSEGYFDLCCTVRSADISCRHPLYDKNVCPSIESAKAHLAMIQLEQLRDCWRNGWKPTSGNSYYTIKFGFKGLDVYCFCTVEFLSFPTREMAEEFLKCFRELIEKAGDLI